MSIETHEIFKCDMCDAIFDMHAIPLVSWPTGWFRLQDRAPRFAGTILCGEKCLKKYLKERKAKDEKVSGDK